MKGKLIESICNQISASLYESEDNFTVHMKNYLDYMDRYFGMTLVEDNGSILIIDADTGAIKEANDKACNFYGYTYNEIRKMNIMDINILPKEELLGKIKQSQKTHFQKFNFKHRLANSEIRDVSVYTGPFKIANKDYIYSVKEDIAKSNTEKEDIMNHLKMLEDVLRGITDVIGVYKPNHTILFFNQAGYEFYNMTLEDVKGKKCYEMLGRDKRCMECVTDNAIKIKGIARIEKYIPELNRYMDCCCNPILDDLGEVVLVVEQMRDITEKKILENILEKSEEKYRHIVDLSPDAIVIIVDGIVVLANEAASKLYGRECYEVIGCNIYNFIDPKYIKTLRKRMSQILKNEINGALYDYRIVRFDKSVIDVEILSKCVKYQGKLGIQCVIRDITEKKENLKKAANIQKNSLQGYFPIPDKAEMKTLYIPAKTVSGDFFHFHMINENLVVGILGDVCGKGITAALNISAVNVLFHEIVSTSEDPLEILNSMNKKIGVHLGDTYIAACCFTLDFLNNKAKIVGAGINEFSFKNSKNEYEEKIVKGPFLGMFDDSVFDEEIINFNAGDEFYFYTDGLDFIFSNDLLKKKYIVDNKLGKLEEYLNDTLSDVDSIKDDCTLIKLLIK